jgi:hypothetical protein
MKLSKTVRLIQYQVAKLEVIEVLFLLRERSSSSLDVRLAHSMISTLRSSLYEVTEACLEASIDNLELHKSHLLETLNSVNNYLSQMVSGLPIEDPQSLFIKEVIVRVISELISLSSTIDQPQNSPDFQVGEQFQLPVNFIDAELELEILS